MENSTINYFSFPKEDYNKYNNENNFSITIDINKICFFKGESIKGSITIKPKNIIKKSLLLCTIAATASLEEVQNYRIGEAGFDNTEETILFKYPMNIPKFQGNNIINGMKIPFEFQIPLNAYPSCFFNSYNYVKHILVFDISSIEVKKSIVLVIKNDQYYNSFNELYKSPIEVKMKTSKHKFAIFHMGYISASLKLDKNSFSYKEAIPLIIDIDCATLKIKIQKVHIEIFLVINKNIKSNHKQVQSKIEKKIFTKFISLLNKKNSYHIEDIIQLPKNNPSDVYQKLNSENMNNLSNLKSIYLYPSCYGGLLSCQYYLKIMFETDTLFSTNEFILTPIDFYEKGKKDEKEEDDKSNKIQESDIPENFVEKGIFETPFPMSSHSNEKEIIFKRSNTQNENNIQNIIPNKKNFNEDYSSVNTNLFKINVQKPLSSHNNNNSNNNIYNDNMVTAEGEINEGFDAPPSVFHEDPKKNKK